MDDDWTLAELSARAARALAAAGVQVPSGRVSEVPDARLIRWYTTIGLVDRPRIGPGRTARYGQRQLTQVVAIKRLQAQGLSLAAVRERLGAASEEELGRLTRTAPTAPVVRSTAAAPAVTGSGRPAPVTDPLVAAPIHGVSVGGLTMLLAGEPTADDLHAIADAAAPLLALLADRGLITPIPHVPSAPHHPAPDTPVPGSH